MKLFIFDTETTGLPRKKVSALVQAENWPHIVSISWIVMESDTNEILEKKTYIIKPNGWIIPEDSIKIHGITQDFAEKNGADLGEVMKEVLQLQFDMMIAHNIVFDDNVLTNAIRWDAGHYEFPGFSCLKGCTMQLSKNICRIPSLSTSMSPFKRGYKPPKLKELYEFIYKKKPDESKLHGSAYDTEILSECVIGCHPLRVALGLVPTSTSNTNASNKSSSSTLYL